MVVTWPAAEKPVVRFTFTRFKGMGSFGLKNSYSSDTIAENLWNKPIVKADFILYVFDKNKVRIGEAYLSVSNLNSGESAKFVTSFESAGVPASYELIPDYLPDELQSFLPPKTIAVSVVSSPSGASVKLDGKDAGTTPTQVQLTLGAHVFEFTKEGFNRGTFHYTVKQNDISGGTITYELGTSAHDTLELRDGSILSGDIESISATQVFVKVGGAVQKLDRNQVKRILLVQRDSPQ